MIGLSGMLGLLDGEEVRKVLGLGVLQGDFGYCMQSGILKVDVKL